MTNKTTRSLSTRIIHGSIGCLFFIDRMMERQPLGTIVACATKEPMVALTFDDGPHEEYTPKLLDILAQHGVHATFFIVGEQAHKHPEIVRRIATDGHTVANHTWNHPMMSRIPSAEQQWQIKACAKEIAPYSQGQPIFRPPWGMQNPQLMTQIYRMGYLNVTWNIDIDDWNDHEPTWFAAEIRRQIHPGTIMLLHDRVTPPADSAAFDRTNMLSGLDIALGELVQTYHFVTVPELLKHGKALTRRLSSNRLKKLYKHTS